MKLVKGTKVTVTANISGHAYEIGKPYKLWGKNANLWILEENGKRGNWNISEDEFQLQATTREEFEKEIEGIEKTLADLNAKVDWMDKNKIVEFDETEYKCWSALKALDSKGTAMDKAKIIAKLIKGE